MRSEIIKKKIKYKPRLSWLIFTLIYLLTVCPAMANAGNATWVVE